MHETHLLLLPELRRCSGRQLATLLSSMGRAGHAPQQAFVLSVCARLLEVLHEDRGARADSAGAWGARADSADDGGTVPSADAEAEEASYARGKREQQQQQQQQLSGRGVSALLDGLAGLRHHDMKLLEAAGGQLLALQEVGGLTPQVWGGQKCGRPDTTGVGRAGGTEVWAI